MSSPPMGGNSPGGRSAVQADWFVSPGLHHWLITLPAVVLMEVLCFAPQSLPTEYMGPLGRFLDNLIHNHASVTHRILLGGNVVHLLEGLVAYRLSRKLKLNSWTTFKWTTQTAIFGVVSLGIILRKAMKGQKKTS